MATFIKFKNQFKGNVSDDIWINIEQITSVFESISSNSETNEIQPSVTLFAREGLSWQIEESLSVVIVKINGSDFLQDGMSKHFKRTAKAKKSVDDLKKL